MILSLVVLKRQPKDFNQMSRLGLNRSGGVSWLFQPWGRLGVQEGGGRRRSRLLPLPHLPSFHLRDIWMFADVAVSMNIFNAKCDSWQSWPPCRGVLLLTLSHCSSAPTWTMARLQKKNLTVVMWCFRKRQSRHQKESRDTLVRTNAPLRVFAKCDHHLPVTPH